MNGFARWTASFLGTLPVAIFLAISIARHLPVGLELRFALGFLLLIPLWVTGICSVCLVERGGRAWLVCLGLAACLGFIALR